jgi:uncharacterized membrane protein
MTSVPSTIKPGGGWIKPLLLASLMLNIMVVGAIAGRAYINRQAALGVGGSQGALALVQFARTLPPDQAREVRQIAKVERPKLRALRQGAQSARDEFVRLLAAETIDPAGLGAAGRRVVEAEQTVRRTQLEAVAKVAAKLAPAERSRLAEFIRSRQRAWQQREGGENDPGTARDD